MKSLAEANLKRGKSNWRWSLYVVFGHKGLYTGAYRYERENKNRKEVEIIYEGVLK